MSVVSRQETLCQNSIKTHNWDRNMFFKKRIFLVNAVLHEIFNVGSGHKFCNNVGPWYLPKISCLIWVWNVRGCSLYWLSDPISFTTLWDMGWYPPTSTQLEVYSGDLSEHLHSLFGDSILGLPSFLIVKIIKA